MKKHKTKEEKQEIIKLFRELGVSRSEFCKTHSISPTSLRNWMHSCNATTEIEPITFVEGVKLKKEEMTTDNTGIQLEYKEVKLTFPRTIEVAYLRDVIQVMLYV